jgi:hypothetical protein
LASLLGTAAPSSGGEIEQMVGAIHQRIGDAL